MPGVSTSAISASFRRATPSTRVRVVCGLSETIATFSPTSALTSVDLPALGRPTTAISPTLIAGSGGGLPDGRLETRRSGARRLDADAVDAPPVRLLDREAEVRLPVCLARLRDVAEPAREESPDGRELLALRPAREEVADDLDVGLSRDRVGVVAGARDRLALVLVLVGDLADDLHDDRHPEVPALEFPEQLRHLLGLGHEVGLAHESGHGARRARADRLERVLDVHDADDGVDRAAHDRDARVLGLDEEVEEDPEGRRHV